MNKLTDSEVISIDEAIRHCYETYYERDDMCKECREEHRQLAKWLEELKESRETINRQKAEIERLEKARQKQAQFLGEERGQKYELINKITKAKTETIKEFAEQVKMAFYYEFDELIPSIMADKIDNLVKEMGGG